MNGFSHLEYVEVDPTGRYGRYNEILGKGSSKTVYRAFDEYEGIEVAWNQVKLYDFLQSSEDLERLYSEIHLLKALKHKNIMKFYASWVDSSNRNINFVTEMFTSGTLRQYRLKHKRVNIRAVKQWCRQILRGLLYLHSHDPPIIHRDLKCDNIFINGNQGEVKIGDLGLAAILRKSHAAHCVGTPEFMAPEVYDEAYNELVDIYSFGMCILEMVTFEYPYSECTHSAQIYKKVTSGKKPDALYKLKDPEVRQFVEKCLATASRRLSARELLNDPFLQSVDCDSDSRELDCQGAPRGIPPLIRQPYNEFVDNTYCYSNGYSNKFGYQSHNELEYCPLDVEPSGIELFGHHDDEHSPNVDISIKGKNRDDGSVFLRLRISDKESRIRNIYFPFDIESDTALSVATEMIAELDITDQDVTKIADMIDGEVSSLVPEWRPGPGIVETPRFANQTFCHNCVSTRTSSGSLMEFLSSTPCCLDGCASMHGRFEEITIQADQSQDQTTKVAENELSRSDCIQYQEIWCQQDNCELTLVGSGRSHSDEEYEKFHLSIPEMDEMDEKEIKIEDEIPSGRRKSVDSIQYLSGCGSFCTRPSLYGDILRSHEDEIQQKLRWLNVKYQIDFKKLTAQRLELAAESSTSSQEACDEHLSKPSAYDKLHISNFHVNLNNGSPNLDTEGAQICVAKKEFLKGDSVTGKSYYSGSLLPISLHRTRLPVDAVDV